MSTKTPSKAPKSCERCSRWKYLKRRLKVSELLQSAVKALENKINDKEFKPSLGDYLKLLQIEQDFEHESPKEIKVTWVERPATSDGEK